MKNIKYIMMFALGLSALSTNTSARLLSKERREEIKTNFKAVGKKISSAALIGSGKSVIEESIKEAKKIVNRVNKNKNIPDDMLNSINTNLNSAENTATELASSGNIKESQKVIQDALDKTQKNLEESVANSNDMELDADHSTAPAA